MTIKSKCTSVQISNITKVCSKCPPCARMQARFIDKHLVENVLTLRSVVTSAGQRHVSGCDASPTSRSVLASGQDYWLTTELERWNLLFSCAQKHVDNTGRSPLYLDQWRTSRYATDCSQQPTRSPIARTSNGFSRNATSGQRCIGNGDILSSVFAD